MSDVRILTPRGRTLAGTFTDPVDTGDAAVLFSHSFLANRHSGEHFDRLARTYRGAGYATLEFDYSGHGRSDDEIITREALVEDLRAASGWLADQGFPRQIIHGHSYGALTALAAAPPAAMTMVVSSPILASRTYEWDRIFSEEQLDDLDRHGVTTIPDDLPGTRRNFTISKQSLIDLSMVDTQKLLAGHHRPILVIHDADDVQTGLVEETTKVFHLLPDGSRVEVVHDARFALGERPEALAEPALEWARLHVPVLR
ncbi:alpha/beta fold hydrolase [Schaalia sp. 19OD2882]|uniref:alpha/beta hydrolase n=1 Tax=Schaalia sp. 19OD2882 TaxID=2794089 RepID=UPI001C1EFADB|nr:alpha/beta fold hydrolase [Schaalia sp. 19OD2882]QWW19692.1 alpha/beta fold hydrolase [Schaalia sp. 19OD2882]